MLRHLERHQGPGHEIDARAPVLLRDVQPVEAEFLRHRDEALAVVRRQFARVRVEVRFERHDLLVHEAAHRLEDQSLFGSEFEVHCLT